MYKKKPRLKRLIYIRKKISKTRNYRLSIFKSNLHIYANIFSIKENKIITTASTNELTIKYQLNKKLLNYGNILSACIIGERIAEKAKNLGIYHVSFDRSGFKYHGRIKALADNARRFGLKF